MINVELNDAQYRRVAQWLDGEPVALSEVERATAEEIRRAESQLSGALEVAPPTRATDAAMAGIMPRLGGTRAKVLHVVRPAMVAAAAVLLALFALRVLSPGPTRQVVDNGLPVDQIVKVYDAGENNIDLDLITAEVNRLAANMAGPAPTNAIDAEIDDLQFNVDTFWLDDAEPWPGDI